MSSPLRRSAVWFWRQWLQPILLAAAIVLPLKSSLAEWNYVPSGSMLPSLMPGDLVWVNKLAYDLKIPFTTRHLATWGDPQRGDVAVFYSPADGLRLVKRVIGLPGDEIEARGDRLWINGVPVDYEPLPIAPAGAASPSEIMFAEEQLAGRPHPVQVLPGRRALRTFGPVRVPAGSYFMMGDNRDDSHDSRFFGSVPRASFIGRASRVIASVDLDHFARPRTDRLLRAIP